MPQSSTLQTGLGRYVGGDHANKRDKDKDGRDIAPDKQQFEIGIAYDKTDPDIPRWFMPVLAHVYNEFNGDAVTQGKIATAANYFATHGAQALDKDFSWKIWDGDKPNREGQVSEHTRGKWVFYFKSSFPFKFSNSQNAEIPATALKRGDYVDMAFTVAGNGLKGENAGIYWNPQFIRLCYEGDAIGGVGPSASEAFSAPAQYAMPAGARAPGAHAAPPPMAMPGGAPMPGQGATGFPQPATMPVGGPTAPMPAPAGFAPTPAAPATAFPSNPAPGNAPPPSGGLPTGFPGNVPSHPTFASGPAAPFPPR